MQPFRFSRLLIATAALFSAIAATAQPTLAEVFVLKSGGRIEGEVLNPNRERGQPYQVRTEEGVKLALADATVARVIVKTDVDKQYEALLPKLENTAEAQWAMSEWCKEAGLTEQRKRHLQAVIALDPNHAEARKALGYQRRGTRWLTPEEFMQSVGFVRYKGAWRTRQEVEIASRQVQQELNAKKLRKDIFMWLEQVASNGRLRDAADKNLTALEDPAAAPALAEIIGDDQQPLAARKRCLEILSRLPPGMATGTMVRVAMNDADASIREACLDELKRQGPATVVPAFVLELKSKDNKRVNRAADCLAALGDPSATLPLISALVTEHRFQVVQGSNPGSIGGTFSPNGSPGAGGMSMGGKPQYIKKQLQNSGVLGALMTIHPTAQNNQYDIEAWRAWYTKTQTTVSIDLRRTP